MGAEHRCSLHVYYTLHQAEDPRTILYTLHQAEDALHHDARCGDRGPSPRGDLDDLTSVLRGAEACVAPHLDPQEPGRRPYLRRSTHPPPSR